jgi:tyrosine-protein phosphatase YwqE
MSWFSGLFKKQPQKASEHFVNPVKVELHSHLIPGIDDGCENLEQSLEVLKLLQQKGYEKVITTPHIMGDFYKNGKHNIIPGLEQLRAAAATEGITLQIEAAAEYMIDESLEQKIMTRDILTFGNNYVLLEMPFQQPSPNMKKVFFELQINGYQPILAHPERYMYFAARKDKYNELADAGVLFQVNLFSLLGYYNPAAKRAAEYLIEQKLVHFVGSDIHGPRHLPVFRDAIQSYNYEQLCTHCTLLNHSL